MVSETYTIRDVYLVAFNGTEKWYNNFAHDTEVAFTYDSESALHNTSVKSGYFEKTVIPNGDWKLSFKAKGTTKYNAGARWGIKSTSSSSMERQGASVQIENYATHLSVSSSSSAPLSKYSISAMPNYTNFTFIAEGNTLKCYRENSLIQTITCDWLHDELILFVHGWVNYIDFYWKDIILEPL